MQVRDHKIELLISLQTRVFRLATPLIRTFTSLAVKVATVEAPMAPNGASTADDKLVALRELMEKADGGNGVDAYIVPTEDPHMVCTSVQVCNIINGCCSCCREAAVKLQQTFKLSRLCWPAE